MDSYREHPSDFDLPSATESSADDVAAAIGTDERRMHVRAYNHWASLLRGRDFPSIEDLEPDEVEDFSSHSVLLDFTCGRDDPAIPYVGGAIRDECGLNDDMRNISEVPSRSLLSRLTDHYMQIIANRSPVGFEAEFENPAGDSICYRGILMPFSSDGDAIDFIYGVINWKRVGEPEYAAPIEAAFDAEVPAPAAVEEVPLELTDVVEAAIEPAPIEEATEEFDAPAFDEEATAVFGAPAFGEEPGAELDTPTVAEEAVADFEEPTVAEEQVADLDDPTAAPPRVPFSWENVTVGDDDDAIAEVALDADAGLADRLWAARETAETVKAGEGRTRAALYKALSLAYDFAVAADQSPAEYAELLEESGVKAQARAPMTPIVKLVFGIDYDKARLTEFAAALSFARRQDIELGGFQAFIEKQSGGLKALVAAERAARRPEGNFARRPRCRLLTSRQATSSRSSSLAAAPTALMSRSRWSTTRHWSNEPSARQSSYPHGVVAFEGPGLYARRPLSFPGAFPSHDGPPAPGPAFGRVN
jgi:hypothetical protein